MTIRPVKLNHMNVVLADFDESVRHFKELYGAEFVVDIPQRELHACLVEMGRVIFELFVPHEYLLNARYGPHFLGVEYQADMDVVRAEVADRGIRIVRDIDIALHTHPADCFGVSFEFYGDEFHSRDWPLLGGPIKPADYWRDDHPLGLTGLYGYTLAVADIVAAAEFLQGFVGGEVIQESALPAIGGRAIGLQVGDAMIELVAPVGGGVLADHLYRLGDGIRSTVFRVRDIEQARRYFIERGVKPAEGTMPDGFAIPAEANLGIIFEFIE